jgi:putative membrane protein
MGAADIVPGVSGGTVALVLGIYERLIRNVHAGATTLKLALRGKLGEATDAAKRVEWGWLIMLLVGILIAIAVLSSVLENLLHDHPVRMAALFFGLVGGSVIVAWRLIPEITTTAMGIIGAVGVALFLLLGLRSETEAFGEEIVTKQWWIFALAGALAICAMILPGISGSFILVMVGMYTEVLGAVNDRDLLPLAATAAGCIAGLAVFSSVLTWLLDNYHDAVIAAMIGLMLGSLRVLWPWPAGTNTTDLGQPIDDVGVPILIAVGALAAVIIVDYTASRAQRSR